MNRSTLVITMVSSNLSDLMGGNQPRNSRDLSERPNNETDPSDPGAVESQPLSAPDLMPNATDFNQVTP